MARTFRTSVSAIAMAIVAAGDAAAQTTGSSGEPSVLDEIIVTAQKREQSILDVPISVTALSGDLLEERGFNEVNDLQFIAPNLTFSQGNTSRISNLAIRGVGTLTFSDSIEGSVGIVVDGVVIGRAGGGLFDFADVERIEVLRGPQGTLFGKNASAGLLNIVTKRPSDEPEFNGSLTVAEPLGQFKASASVSAPISDAVGFRLSGFYNESDGLIDNPVDGRNLNGTEEYGIKGKLEFDFASGTNLLLSGDISEREGECCAWTVRQLSAGGPGTGLLGTGFPLLGTQLTAAGIPVGPENEFTLATGSFENEGRTGGLSATLTHPLSDTVTLTAISAYREWEQFDNNDADQTPLNLLDVNDGLSEQEQLTQEIRLDYSGGGALNGTFGLFYFDQTVRADQTQQGGYGLDLLGVLPPGTLLDRSFINNNDTTNIAAFVDATYAVSDTAEIFGGLRLQNETLDVDFTRTNENPFSPLVLGEAFAPTSQAIEVGATALAWRLGARADLTEEVSVYASVARGYKGPGVNVTTDVTQLAEIRPEVPTSFEVGAKTLLADGRVNFNAAAYYTTFDDFQAQSLTASDSGTLLFGLVNAGELEVYGVEGDFNAQLTEDWFLSGGFSVSESKFKEFTGAECFNGQTVAQGCVNIAADGAPAQFAQDLSGADLPNAPGFTFNATTTYELPEFDVAGGLNPFVSGSIFYRSSTLLALDNDPRTEQDGYALFDASVGLRSADDAWALTLFGKNIFDQDFVELIFDTPFDDGGFSQFVNPASQATVGLRLDVGF